MERGKEREGGRKDSVGRERVGRKRERDREGEKEGDGRRENISQAKIHLRY